MNSETIKNTPLVSVVIVPRHQFGILVDCVDALYANTDLPFETIVVHLTEGGKHPAPNLDYPNLKVIESSDMLLPHESKNIALEKINPDAEWIVFMDNDVTVHPDWLTALISAAEESGSRVAHPLYLIERKGKSHIHMAHGEFRTSNGPGHYLPVMGLGNRPIDVADNLERRPSDFVEFHCWMLHRDVMNKLGQFEPISIGEHIHHSLLVTQLGESIVFEPKSVITYNADVDDTPGSKTYLRHRWSHKAARRSIHILKERWPDFSRHWQSKYLAAWEFRSSIEPWYPVAARALKFAGKLRHRLRSARKTNSFQPK